MQYLTGIAFGATALLGYGLDNIALAFASKKYGSIKTAAIFFMMVMAISAIPAIFLFSFNNFSIYADILVLVTGAVSFVAFVSFVKGFEVGNVSVVASIANGWGVITVALSILFLNEHLSPLSILEVLLIIVGVALVSFRYKSIRREKLNRISEGVKYALITMMGWGTYYFLDALLVLKIGWFDAFFLLNLITLAFVFSYSRVKSTKLMSLGRGSYVVLFLGALTNVVAGIAYNLGVAFNFAAVVAPVASAAVMLPVLFGILFLKERPEKTQMLGMAIIILSIIALTVQ